ncbi:MAG: Tfp pilus assembly protein PilX [Gammaproteobacteria bacterium]|jgi:Tfp pilus assembly protein PilX
MLSTPHNTKQISVKQSGATLITALMFLLMMTLFAVSSINMGVTNLKIINNMQATKVLDSTSRDIIEQLVSTIDTFVETPTNTVNVTEYNPATSATVTTAVTVGAAMTTTALGTQVTIADPECLDSVVAAGYSVLDKTIIPEDNTWEVVVTLVDPFTGANNITHQGAQMRQLANNCPG